MGNKTERAGNMARLKPLNDFIFQKLMGEQGSEDELKSFLSAVLGRKLKDVTILENKTLTPEIIGDKGSILDVRAITDESIIEEVLSMDAAIQKTNDRLNFLSQDKEFLHRVNLRDIALSDYTTAMNDAKDEGREEARKEFENEIKKLKDRIKELEAKK